MQVWSRVGICVFEQPLKKPVTRWNLFKNKLLFMEQDDIVKILICGETEEDT